MREYIELGSTPSDEDCVQVAKDKDYLPAMLAECRKYKAMLENIFPIPDDICAYFRVKEFPHDFGSYAEVCIYYDENDSLAQDFAYFVESNLPKRWTDNKVLEYTREEETQLAEEAI